MNARQKRLHRSSREELVFFDKALRTNLHKRKVMSWENSPASRFAGSYHGMIIDMYHFINDRKALQAELDAVAAKFGVTISLGRITYYETSFNSTLTVTLADAEPLEVKFFKDYFCRFHEDIWKPEDIGMKFDILGASYKLVGALVKNGKLDRNWLTAECTSSRKTAEVGKVYRFRPYDLGKHLGRITPTTAFGLQDYGK